MNSKGRQGLTYETMVPVSIGSSQQIFFVSKQVKKARLTVSYEIITLIAIIVYVEQYMTECSIRCIFSYYFDMALMWRK